jgi:hypothetical protein
LIPPPIIRFLEERANIGFAGTRDADLVPRGHRVSGWRIGPGGATFTALMPGASMPDLLDALLANGRFAVTLEEAGTHETYQVKGRYRSHRSAGREDIDLADRLRERFVKAMRAQYPQSGVAERLGESIPAPSLAVEIDVDDVFVQTPGPGAGSRLAGGQ